MIFRRLLYLPDDSIDTSSLHPVASILYINTVAASQETDDVITLVGTAQAFGNE